MKRVMSLKTKTMIGTSCLIVPILILVLCFNLYTIARSDIIIYENSLAAISLYKNELENNLTIIESAVVSIVATEEDYMEMNSSLSDLKKYENLYYLNLRFRDLFATHESLQGVYLYAAENDVSRLYVASTYTHETKEQLLQTLEACVQQAENPTKEGWFYIHLEESSFLVRVMGIDSLFMVAIVDPAYWSVLEIQESYLAYASEDGTVVTQVEYMSQFELNLDSEGSDYGVLWGDEGRYVVVVDQLEYAKTELYYIQPYSGVLGGMDMIQIMLLLSSIGICVLLPVVAANFTRKNFSSLENLIDTIHIIRKEQRMIKMETDYDIKEFVVLSRAFNNMVSEINDLKIASYETKLAEQQMKYLLLQTQIRPHFYLNTLKNIQALAQQENYQKIQEFALNISVYLRYLMHEEKMFVTLEDELTSVESYIAVQNTVASADTLCTFEITDDVRKIMIPPISLLTFAENSIKHAFLPSRQLCITVKSTLLEMEGDCYLNITFSDNGPGFSQEMLERLNQPEIAKRGLALSNKNIGVYNVMHRFDILYKGEAVFSYRNLADGCCIEIYIPLKK